MTGPEHYAEAERLLSFQYAKERPGGLLADQVDAETVALAQVHATLALAAATVTNMHPQQAKANLEIVLAWNRAGAL